MNPLTRFWPERMRSNAFAGFLLATQALGGIASAADLTERQVQLLSNNCIQCHARPNIGVPLIGNPEDWVVRVQKGEDALLASVIVGLKGMPPLGYCSACSVDDFLALNRFMANIEELAK